MESHSHGPVHPPAGFDFLDKDGNTPQDPASRTSTSTPRSYSPLPRSEGKQRQSSAAQHALDAGLPAHNAPARHRSRPSTAVYSMSSPPRAPPSPHPFQSHHKHNMSNASAPFVMSEQHTTPLMAAHDDEEFHTPISSPQAPPPWPNLSHAQGDHADHLRSPTNGQTIVNRSPTFRPQSPARGPTVSSAPRPATALSPRSPRSPVRSPQRSPVRSPEQSPTRSANPSMSSLHTKALPKQPGAKSSRNWQPLAPQAPLAPPQGDGAALGTPKKKMCSKCATPISGQFVRALGTAFHLGCFTCGDCGTPCAQKFFPVDGDKGAQTPLCERCYFKRLDLLCYRCDGALRGSYITALDRKYHVDHFTCSLCPVVFGPDDSYYEHNSDVYCHYHYSTLHAARCEGCHTSILKQFVETYRGGREQQWHPECYMIFKFWNVKLAPPHEVPAPMDDTSAAAKAQARTRADPGCTVEDTARHEVSARELDIDKLVLSIWTTLCSFEEVTASHISAMVQCAVAGQYRQALAATTELVQLVQVLFSALDALPATPQESQLGKEPKTLCRKIVAYMSLVSKTRQDQSSGLSNDLLTVASSIAHYLKVLIRYGLATSLTFDRHDLRRRPVLNQFLSAIGDGAVPARIEVSALTSDRCVVSDKTVEDKCIRRRDLLWRSEYFTCQSCNKPLADSLDDAVAVGATGVACKDCVTAGKVSSAGRDSEPFVHVSRLGQYMFLLYVAVARLELVLGRHDAHDPALGSSGAISASTPTLSFARPAGLHGLKQAGSSDKLDRGYLSTLTDIRRLRQAKGMSSGSNIGSSSNRATLPSESSSNSQASDASSTTSPRAKTTSPRATPRPMFAGAGEAVGEAPRAPAALARTSDLLNAKASLTLDDIRRIVATEQAREQMPNAFRHRGKENNDVGERLRNPTEKSLKVVYFGEIGNDDLGLVQLIAATLLPYDFPETRGVSELIDKKSQTFWEKMGRAFAPPSKKRGGVFGVPLEQLNERSAVDSSLGVGPYTLRIPSFVDDCVLAMRQKDMSIEGIFRKNGNIRRVREFVEKVNEDPEQTQLLADEQPIQLAALLKKFLREMPEPLLGSKLAKLWVQVSTIPEDRRANYLRLVVCLLGKPYRDMFEVLVHFLNWTASFAHLDEEAGSKMDAHNLATVITPNILFARSDVESGGDMYLRAIEAVYLLIEQHLLVAHVPPQVVAVLAKVKERKRDKQSSRELADLVKEVVRSERGEPPERRGSKDST